MSKAGLVLEGGALRGVFSAGVTDFLIEKEVKFPYVIGVSAGGASALAMRSKQIGRAKKVISYENARPYIGPKAFFRCGRIVDIYMVTEGYAEKEFPVDYDTYYASDVEVELVAAGCESGAAEYLPTPMDYEHIFGSIKATCAVPFAVAPIEIDGRHYLDGSLMDSIPIARAVEKGCDKMVVVLTRPEGGKPTDYRKMKPLIDLFYRKKYPKLADAMLKRAEFYQEQVEYMERLEKEGRVMIIRPTMSIGHFEKDKAKIDEYYMSGYNMMKDRCDEMLEFISS